MRTVKTLSSAGARCLVKHGTMTRNSLNVQHLGIDRRNGYCSLHYASVFKIRDSLSIDKAIAIWTALQNLSTRTNDSKTKATSFSSFPDPSSWRRAEISGHRITSDSADSRSIDFVSPQGVKERLLDIPYVHINVWRGSIPMRGHSGRAAAAWDTRGCISRSHA